MSDPVLEHVNLTVTNPGKTAAMLCKLFGWHIRWEGDAIDGGRSVHVGSDTSYLALYSPKTPPTQTYNNYVYRGGLNHVGVVVDDLDALEAKVTASGYKPHSHADYEPGKRFYFHDEDGVEYEVISYA